VKPPGWGIGGEELFEHFKVPTALNLFGVPNERQGFQRPMT